MTIGTKIFFKRQAPTQGELKVYPRIYMISQREWNPATVSLGKITTDQIQESTPDKIKEKPIRSLKATE